MFLSLLLTDIIFHLFLSILAIRLISLLINHSSLNNTLSHIKMDNNQVRNLQIDQNLRVIQPAQVEPVVYRSNQSIISSYGSSQISTIDQQISTSQSTLSSYLHRSGISSLNDIASCHIHQVFEINEGESLRLCNF